jgi:hypothetical protein
MGGGMFLIPSLLAVFVPMTGGVGVEAGSGD